MGDYGESAMLKHSQSKADKQQSELFWRDIQAMPAIQTKASRNNPAYKRKARRDSA